MRQCCQSILAIYQVWIHEWCVPQRGSLCVHLQQLCPLTPSGSPCLVCQQRCEQCFPHLSVHCRAETAFVGDESQTAALQAGVHAVSSGLSEQSQQALHATAHHRLAAHLAGSPEDTEGEATPRSACLAPLLQDGLQAWVLRISQ